MIKETCPYPKWINNMISSTANFEQREDVFILLSFCDESWDFGIKASYFCKAFSGKKLVTVSQQECFGLERIGISPIIDWSPSLRYSSLKKHSRTVITEGGGGGGRLA